MPDSPLIDRPHLSLQEEEELKRICGVILANVQNSDDAGDYPVSDLIHKLQQAENENTKTRQPHASVQGSSQGASKSNRTRAKEPKPVAAEKTRVAVASTLTVSEIIRKGVADLEQSSPWNIRSKLNSRPKTSAAACTDSTEDNTPVSSNPSNRTTYSTPATSAGVTPGETRKRFFQGSGGPRAAGESPSPCHGQDQARVEPQLEQRRSSISTDASKPPQRLQGFQPLHSSQPFRSASRASSIKKAVREYFRPGSSAGSHVRPESAAGSVHSVGTTSSFRPKIHEPWSALKRKISNASLTSRNGTSARPSVDQERPSLGSRPQQTPVDLNRPLPALPGLDSYREKPKHIATLMRPIPVPKSKYSSSDHTSSERKIDPTTVPTLDPEMLQPPSDASHQSETLSRPADVSSRSITEGSANSTPTMTNITTRSLVMVNASPTSERDMARPFASVGKYGAGMSDTGSELPKIEVAPREEPKKRGFKEKWSGKLLLGKKTRTPTIPGPAPPPLAAAPAPAP